MFGFIMICYTDIYKNKSYEFDSTNTTLIYKYNKRLIGRFFVFKLVIFKNIVKIHLINQRYVNIFIYILFKLT